MTAYELYMAVEKKQRKLIRKVNLILLKEWLKGVLHNVKKRK